MIGGGLCHRFEFFNLVYSELEAVSTITVWPAALKGAFEGRKR
jgi:hypothetical protein